jgi:hypothetical protein
VVCEASTTSLHRADRVGEGTQVVGAGWSVVGRNALALRDTVGRRRGSLNGAPGDAIAVLHPRQTSD